MFSKIRVIITKEFKQIFRNKLMLGIIFGLPIVQLMVLSYAIDYEVKDVKVFINDMDRSPESIALINKIENSKYFVTAGYGSYEQGIKLIEKGKSEALISIPQGFGKSLANPNIKSHLQISIDAINGMKAGIGLNYAIAIINSYLNQYLFDEKGIVGQKNIEINPKNWYNPELDYKLLMVPGILVILVTMVALFLSSMNIVREKELGTIEQINVTPIAKREFILGKLLPFVIIGLIEFSIGLTIAKFWFNVPIAGSLVLIYTFTVLYLSLVLGLGMLISNFSETQQQSMFTAWFFAVIFILMSGLFTPIESMPSWAQKITYLNPLRYYIDVLRLILLKGSGIAHVWQQMLSIIALSALANTIAVYTYSKTSK